ANNIEEERAGESDRESNWSIRAMLATGCWLSRLRTARLTAGIKELASADARTTRNMSVIGRCSVDKYICIEGGVFRASVFVPATTPTITLQSFGALNTCMRLPTASCPGQSCRAM